MGTAPAPPYATIYFGIHEKKILGRYRGTILLYRRFLDDVIAIWDRRTEVKGEKWRQFVNDMNDAKGLTWEVNEPSNHVDFMDLSISIDNGKIATTLFEKQSNRHLYISPHSCHPPGMITGVVHGMIRRVLTLCSDDSDKQRRIRQFVTHLRARGHQAETILSIVRAACAKHYAPKQDTSQRQQDPTAPPRIFLHLPFHPNAPSSSNIQRAWKQKVGNSPFVRRLHDVKNKLGKPIGVDRMTVAYHRRHNLGNLLTYRDLSKRNGPPALSLIDG